MFVRVDSYTDNEINGFSYINMDGDEEFVEISEGSIVNICPSNTDSSRVYTNDLPKLIKALQAAYDHIQKGK